MIVVIIMIGEIADTFIWAISEIVQSIVVHLNLSISSSSPPPPPPSSSSSFFFFLLLLLLSIQC